MILQYPFALIGLILVPLIIILRFWQTRPVKVIVSSILIWRQLTERSLVVKSHSIRKLVLITLLQILSVIALVLGLAQPSFRVVTPITPPVIILLDNSVRMGSLMDDNVTTRWQTGIKELKTILNNLPDVTPVSLLSAAKGTSRLYSEKPPQEMIRLIDTLTPLDLPPEVDYLVTQGAGLVNRYKNAGKNVGAPQVYLCSDEMPGAELLNLLPKDLLFIIVGQTSRNCAITHFAATKNHQSNKADLLTRIINFSDTPVNNIPLEIYAHTLSRQGTLSDGQLITKTLVGLKAKENRTFILENIFLPTQPSGPSAPIIEANLKIVDDLACDNRVWLSLNPSRKFRVVLVGKSAPSVLRALQAQPQLEVEYIPVTTSNFQIPVSTFYDLYLFNHCLPIAEQLPSDIKLVLINPPGDFYPFGIRGTITNLVPDYLDLNSTLLEYVNLSEIHLWRGLKIEVAPEAKDSFHTFVSADKNPLIGEWHKGDGHFILLGFDPEWTGPQSQTDWAMSISFPIFWTNLVNYLLGNNQIPITESQTNQEYIFYHSGELIRPDLRTLFTGDQLAKSKNISLFLPDGKEKIFEPEFPPKRDSDRSIGTFAFIPDKVGIYMVKAGDQTRHLAVNLCDERASDNNGVTLKSQIPNLKSQMEKNSVIHLKPLTTWLVLIGLGLLAVAWYLERYA